MLQSYVLSILDYITQTNSSLAAMHSSEKQCSAKLNYIIGDWYNYYSLNGFQLQMNTVWLQWNCSGFQCTHIRKQIITNN